MEDTIEYKLGSGTINTWTATKKEFNSWRKGKSVFWRYKQ